MWAKSWACSSSPTCTRSALPPPRGTESEEGGRLWGWRVGGQGLPQERAQLWGSCLLPSLCLQDWEVQYQQDTPVAPRFDVNAPDLYIPGLPLPIPAPSPPGGARLGQRCRCPVAQDGPSASDQCLCVCLPQLWLSSLMSWWLAWRWGPRIGKGGLE